MVLHRLCVVTCVLSLRTLLPPVLTYSSRSFFHHMVEADNSAIIYFDAQVASELASGALQVGRIIVCHFVLSLTFSESESEEESPSSSLPGRPAPSWMCSCGTQEAVLSASRWWVPLGSRLRALTLGACCAALDPEAVASQACSAPPVDLQGTV